MSTDAPQVTQLSPPAARLLALLRSRHTSPPQINGITDAKLAGLIPCAVRDVVDLARELLEAGWMVCADGGGRWLALPGDDLTAVYKYADSLHGRSMDILVREKLVNRNLRVIESGRSPDTTGQLALFAEAS